MMTERENLVDHLHQHEKSFKLVFNPQQSRNEKGRRDIKGPEYQEEAFEKLASQAFLKIR